MTDRGDQAVFVYATFESVEQARAIGADLVGEGLAACVNIFPGMISIYRWQGEVENAAEAAMLVKTRAGLAEAVMTAITERHSYEMPALLVLPISGGSDAYLDWIAEQTQSERIGEAG